MELKEILKAAEQTAREAGELVLSIRRPKVYVKEGHSNYVTEADVASQKFCIDRLAPVLPEACFFAEEQEDGRLQPGYNWIIDPIDGTTNFMRGCRRSAVSIGLVRDGVPVVGAICNPYSGELFSAVLGGGAFLNGEPIHVSSLSFEEGLMIFGTAPYYREEAEYTLEMIRKIFLGCGDIRRTGSAALDLCDVAAGRSEGFFEARLSPWDVAAASVIVTEAGGKIGTVAPNVFNFEKSMPIVAGNPAVYGELQRLARR